MYKEENKEVARYFDHGCKTCESSWEAAFWESEETQQGFFAIEASLIKPNSKILEVGCGQGDLWEFLFARQIPVEYEGIDVSSEMIKKAREKYPKGNFQHQDLFEKDGEYDFVMGCGSFNLNMFQDHEQYLKDVIKKMYDLSTRSVLIGALSKHASVQYDDTYYYYDPGKILNYCLDLTPVVTLNHASIDHHFLIHMMKGLDSLPNALRGS